jgi:hypothetical protein
MATRGQGVQGTESRFLHGDEAKFINRDGCSRTGGLSRPRPCEWRALGAKCVCPLFLLFLQWLKARALDDASGMRGIFHWPAVPPSMVADQFNGLALN